MSSGSLSSARAVAQALPRIGDVYDLDYPEVEALVKRLRPLLAEDAELVASGEGAGEPARGELEIGDALRKLLEPYGPLRFESQAVEPQGGRLLVLGRLHDRRGGEAQIAPRPFGHVWEVAEDARCERLLLFDDHDGARRALTAES